MDPVDRLIHYIYESSLDADQWLVVLRQLADVVGGSHTHLVLADLDRGLSYVNILFRGDPEGAEEYLQTYAETDFRAPRVLSSRPGLMRDERSYVSAQEARASVIHNEFLPRFGIHNIAGASMQIDGCFGWLGLSTRKKDEPFSEGQMALLQHVAPHIHRALRMAKSRMDLVLLEQRRRQAEGIVTAGIIAFDGGEAISTNAAADALLAEGFFNLRDGALTCASRSGSAAIGRLAASADAGALNLRDERDGRRYLLRRHNLPGAPQGFVGRFALSITECEARMAISLNEVRDFCSGSGVTPAEAHAIHASLTDQALATLADARGIGLDTARKQLKSALSKLGLDSQRQLHRMFERYRLLGDPLKGRSSHSPSGE